MTTEEKAQAYDEAIERARRAYNNYKEQLEAIEDKKYNAAIMISGGISALEYQFPELKESKDERMWKLLKKYVHCNISDIVLEYDHITREELESWLEKQKEQKSTVVKDYRLRDTWEYLDEFVKKFGRYPKDADEISACIDYVIKRRGEQKPAEWSEEDEKRLKSCITILQASDGHDTINTKWLKSLHPQKQWTPSEEQMESLKTVYEFHTGAANVCLRNTLYSLYNDLKQL